MAAVQLTTVVRHLRHLAQRRDRADVSDGELLGLFVRHRDESAFAELVHRHGPMVLGVCRRVVGHVQDAEDAFQATFLVLVKRAGSVRPAERVGNWLYGVAHRTALEARRAALRRREKEAKVEMMLPQPPQEDDWADLRSQLDLELNRLPDKYRVPIVLCDLEGKTRKQVAQQLGWADGTVASRLARGRELLARRLAVSGKPVTVCTLMMALAPDVTARVPEALSNATIEAAACVAAGTAVTAGVVPAKVAALVEGVTRMMLLSKLKITTAVLVGLALAVAGFGVFTQPSAAIGEPATQARPRAADAEKKTADADEGEPLNGIWITDPRVHKELRLSEAQVKKLTAIRTGVYKKHEADLKKAQEEAKKFNYATYRELSRKIQTEERTAVQEEAPKILSAAAIKRLRQIQRQARGLHHVMQQQVVQKKLGLDDEQTKQIEGFLKKGLEQSRKEASKRVTGPILAPMTIEDHVVMEQKAYADSMKSVVGVLTKEQLRIWNDLIGEPFGFKASSTK